MQRIIAKIISMNDFSLHDIFNGEKSRIYTFLNPVSYLNARREQDIFYQFDGIFADGSLLVAAVKLLYFRGVKRRSFDMTSVATSLFQFCEKNNKSIYIIASKGDEVTYAVEIFKKQYPALNVIYYRTGYFSTQEEIKEEIDNIQKINPDFLIVGMGIVKQEMFLQKVKQSGFKGIGFTCGGFISQTYKNKGTLDYYPYWVDKYNIRFLYRMYKEKHTRVRYFQAAFLFPILFLKDRFFLNI